MIKPRSRGRPFCSVSRLRAIPRPRRAELTGRFRPPRSFPPSPAFPDFQAGACPRLPGRSLICRGVLCCALGCPRPRGYVRACTALKEIDVSRPAGAIPALNSFVIAEELLRAIMENVIHGVWRYAFPPRSPAGKSAARARRGRPYGAKITPRPTSACHSRWWSGAQADGFRTVCRQSRRR